MTETEILKVKQMASDHTGVPIELISGESVEEIAASAAGIAAFKREHDQQIIDIGEYPTRDQFAMWLTGETPTQTEEPAGYPVVMDGGEVANFGQRDPVDAFKEWFGKVSAYNPRKNN